VSVRAERAEDMRVEIWSDIACPWCYVGKARFEKALDAFPHRDDIEVVHRSFELDPGRAKGDIQPVIKMLTKKYGMSEAQAQAGEENLGTQAAAEGLDYRTRAATTATPSTCTGCCTSPRSGAGRTS
jgi:predicted DsbA family dithiol-disulfide isomerase